MLTNHRPVKDSAVTILQENRASQNHRDKVSEGGEDTEDTLLYFRRGQSFFRGSPSGSVMMSLFFNIFFNRLNANIASSKCRYATGKLRTRGHTLVGQWQ
ncbi:hypothetical protein [Umezakia ovalisporum]|uniref:hypothetical protein n=1 Tax=Umezakia ovalisporum TaxID=75695 RepID=UPI0028CB7601|nr:hypothetical protein [Umezakia ovalisporum]